MAPRPPKNCRKILLAGRERVVDERIPSDVRHRVQFIAGINSDANPCPNIVAACDSFVLVHLVEGGRAATVDHTPDRPLRISDDV